MKRDRINKEKIDEIEDVESECQDDNSEIIYLDKHNFKVSALGEDFLSAKYKDKEYERINMARAMPFSMPESYIIVKSEDNKEIGIIKELRDFDEDQRLLIKKHLTLRYYSPKITEILELKDKFGFMYVTVATDSGVKSFASSDLTKSIKRIEGDKYIVIDVEGNRFLIEDIKSVKNSRKIMAYIV